MSRIKLIALATTVIGVGLGGLYRLGLIGFSDADDTAGHAVG